MLRTASILGALHLAGSGRAESRPVGDRVEVRGMKMYFEVSGAGDPLIWANRCLPRASP
jgi:hypothetical protein